MLSAIRPRSAREVFEDHLQKRKDGKIEEDIRENYSEDVILLTGTGIHLGHEGLREAIANLHHYLPNATYDYRTKLVKGEYAFLEWSGWSEKGVTYDGADSYVIRDGVIVMQTIHYTVTEPESAANDAEDDADEDEENGDETET